MLLLNFTHRRQRFEHDCLIACAEMALHHLGLQIDYPRLAKLLQAGPYFTPFNHLTYLKSFRLSVTIGQDGETALFETYLGLGLPVIVGVTTLAWQHWRNEVTQHAVVVVGIDRGNDRIYVNDPFFAHGPIEMPLVEFEIGWIEKGQEYAVIGLVEPD